MNAKTIGLALALLSTTAFAGSQTQDNNDVFVAEADSSTGHYGVLREGLSRDGNKITFGLAYHQTGSDYNDITVQEADCSTHNVTSLIQIRAKNGKITNTGQVHTTLHADKPSVMGMVITDLCKRTR